jgi:CheY-like chemotaxis protein
MDDDESVRALVLGALAQIGYDGVGVADGQAAIAAFEDAEAAGEPFRAVLLDLTIRGGHGGVEVLDRLRLRRADVRVLVMSGYSDDGVLAEPSRHGFDGVVKKPFAVGELAAALERALK